MFGYVRALLRVGCMLTNSPPNQRGRQVDLDHCSPFLLSPLAKKKFVIMPANNARLGLSFAGDATPESERNVYDCPRMCSVIKCSNQSVLNESHRRGKKRPYRRQARTGNIYAQRPKKAPAATRTPTTVAPMPVTLRAPLLPLKAPVDVVPGEVLVDVPDPARVDVLLMVEPTPEVEMEEGPPELRKVDEGESTKDRYDTYIVEEVPFPEEVEESEELEESAASIWNVAVWESTVLTSPTGEAWKAYPGLHKV